MFWHKLSSDCHLNDTWFHWFIDHSQISLIHLLYFAHSTPKFKMLPFIQQRTDFIYCTFYYAQVFNSLLWTRLNFRFWFIRIVALVTVLDQFVNHYLNQLNNSRGSKIKFEVQTCTHTKKAVWWIILVLKSVHCVSPQVLSTDSVERLPVFNKTALRHYKLSLEADDWCVPSKEPLDLAIYRVAKWSAPDLTWLWHKHWQADHKMSFKDGHCGTRTLSPAVDRFWSDQTEGRPSASSLSGNFRDWTQTSSICVSYFLYMCAIHKGKEEGGWRSGSRLWRVKDAVVEIQKEREREKWIELIVGLNNLKNMSD